MSHTENVRIIAESFNHIQIIFPLMLLATFEFDKRLPTFRKCYFYEYIYHHSNSKHEFTIRTMTIFHQSEPQIQILYYESDNKFK